MSGIKNERSPGNIRRKTSYTIREKYIEGFLPLAKEWGEDLALWPELEIALLKHIGRMIRQRAREKIGHLQDAFGPVAAWEPLKDATIAAKEARGMSVNDEGSPPIETGEMKKSIEITLDYGASVKAVHIGSNSDVAVYQELGTEKIPPRSFLAGAAVELAPEIAEMIGQEFSISLGGPVSGGGRGSQRLFDNFKESGDGEE